MISIESHIEYLLYFHDCVIVPDLGAFIIQHESPYICKRSCIANGPRRFISFNAEIKQPDGLLVSSISRKEKISYDASVCLISKFVDRIKHRLQFNGDEYKLGEIGVFKNINSNITFEPESNNNISLFNDFGFEKFKVESLRNKDYLNDDSNVIHLSLSRRMVNYAASVAVLIIMALSLTTPTDFNLSESEMASLSLLKSQKELINRVESNHGELLISMPPANSVAKFVKQEGSNKINVSDFLLVIASFPSLSDANSYINLKQNRFELNVANMNGKYRVYIAASNDISELNILKNSMEISSNFPDAWVCKYTNI